MLQSQILIIFNFFRSKFPAIAVPYRSVVEDASECVDARWNEAQRCVLCVLFCNSKYLKKGILGGHPCNC